MIRLSLFGGAVLHAQGGPITGRAAQRHRIALLALLSSTRRLYRSRDQLVTFLWPDADAERGRKLLSDSIYRINHALGGDAIVGTGEDISLARGVIGSDVADLEAAVESREWPRTVELYSGPFLDGFYLPGATEFDQWMEIERGRYARCAAKAMEALAVGAGEAGRTAEAVDWWQRLAGLVPDDSRIATELMRALEASGHRAGALRHARLHAALLRETLGVEPDRTVQELADRMARRTAAPASALRSAALSAAAATHDCVVPADHGAISIATADVLDLPDTSPFVPATGSLGAPRFGSSIAVLPFKNLCESDSNGYFADGMSEELMHLLTRTPGLRIASPTSVFAYRDMKLDVRDVARRLQVQWILEGSVRRSGSRLRIVAQLTDASNGYQCWSESFDRTSNDIFEIQQEISRAIVNRLAPAMGTGGHVDSRYNAGASDADSYDLYLQARFQWHRRTEVSLSRASELFEQVVARDPGYARAWAGLAETYAVMACYDFLPPQVAFPRAEAAARRAMQLDATLAAPYATLAYVEASFHWNWESSERGFRRAIELEPTNSTAHQWFGMLLITRGRFDEAEREMRAAAELDPLSMTAHTDIGFFQMLNGQADRAIQQFRSVLQLDATFGLAHYWLGLAYVQDGQPSEAISCLTRVWNLSKRCPHAIGALARAHAAAGDFHSTRAMLLELLSVEETGRYVSSYDIAIVHLALGDVPAALTRLERACADRAHAMAFLRVDPTLRSLAADARFQRLVERVDHPPGLIESSH